MYINAFKTLRGEALGCPRPLFSSTGKTCSNNFHSASFNPSNLPAISSPPYKKGLILTQFQYYWDRFKKNALGKGAGDKSDEAKGKQNDQEAPPTPKEEPPPMVTIDADSGRRL
jgi:hypothetical protein